jgi:hypothetical protein
MPAIADAVDEIAVSAERPRECVGYKAIIFNQKKFQRTSLNCLEGASG